MLQSIDYFMFSAPSTSRVSFKDDQENRPQRRVLPDIRRLSTKSSLHAYNFSFDRSSREDTINQW